MAGQEHRVNLIRHQYPVAQIIPLTFKMADGVTNQFGYCRLSQMTRSVSLIQAGIRLVVSMGVHAGILSRRPE